MTWVQPLDPIGNLALSAIVAAIPVLVLLISLCIFRLSGYISAAITSIATIFVALGVYRAPIEIVISSYFYGVLFGIWPVVWVIINAMFLYNLSKETGSLEDLRNWIQANLPVSISIVSLFISFLFGGLVEGIDGYGFPVAISSVLLTQFGLNPIKAIVVSLIANTIPVPFASLGVPVDTLSMVSGLDLREICSMISAQLAVLSVIVVILIFYVSSGLKETKRYLDVALVSSICFGVSLYIVSTFIDPHLTGLIPPIISIFFTLAYLRVRKLKRSKEMNVGRTIRGWFPWLIVVFIMTSFGIIGLHQLIEVDWEVSNLHMMVFIPLYNREYSAVYRWQPFAHGTMVLLASLLVVIIYRVRPSKALRIYLKTWKQMSKAIITILQVLGIAFLMNYVGLSFTLGYALSKTGFIYPFLSTFIGWIGTFVSGSATGSNALFGNLQRVSAELLNLSPYITVSANCSGGAFGKMICLQSIVVGTAAVGLAGREGEIMKKLMPYSVFLTILLSLMVCLLAFLFSSS